MHNAVPRNIRRLLSDSTNDQKKKQKAFTDQHDARAEEARMAAPVTHGAGVSEGVRTAPRLAVAAAAARGCGAGGRDGHVGGGAHEGA